MRITIEFSFIKNNGFWRISTYDEIFGLNVKGFAFVISPIFIEVIYKKRKP